MFSDHTNGTYISLYPSDKSLSKIDRLIKRLNIADPVPSNKLHTTLVFSRNPMPLAQSHKLKRSITAKVDEFDIWPDADKTCLVLKLDAREIDSLHEFYKEHYNATHDYPSYDPHITISYNYQNEPLNFDLVESILPNIQFDQMKIIPLDQILIG